MNVIKEWFIDAPWGKIALVAWGAPKGTPVLLVHGRQDSLATFIPLLERLPNNYHYVGLDLPGNGKSDRFPHSVMLTRTHFVAPVDIVVKALGWKHFIYMGHSMGGVIGLFYNTIRPEKLLKLVLLDTGFALQKQAPVSCSALYAAYEHFYQSYDTINKGVKIHTKASALAAVRHARALRPELVELVLSRNLVPYESKASKCPSTDEFGFEKEIKEEEEEEKEEKFTLAWDQRLKNLAVDNFTFDQWVYICTRNLPPTLFIAAVESVDKYRNDFAGKLINEMRSVPNFKYAEVHGNHDVHLSDPEDIAEEITMFLHMDLFVSKL